MSAVVVLTPDYDDSWLHCSRCSKRMYVAVGGIGDNPPLMHLCYSCDAPLETIVVHQHLGEATP